MIEITEERIRTGFAFGLLLGWWLSKWTLSLKADLLTSLGEDSYRWWSPCLSTNG